MNRNFIKMKNFSSSKNIKKMIKGKAQNGIFVKQLSNKGLVSRKYEGILELKIGKNWNFQLQLVECKIGQPSGK